MRMRERDIKTRMDVPFPYEKIDPKTGEIVERVTEAPFFDIKFYYLRSKKGTPMFKIYAARTEKPD
eukprot:CAMPEP_0170501976 /NCGR_PEP_ID=MMETSP0208-20121228/40073_1 /TAXON_ID=197538 /ORGANISM="Strombidium inclinatum, Strain S3" /LENGTH=65 /DNA_ID=CAMNT_0010780813 /DNA_START=1264 /DNA_END=1461 /DNA_ORIENTATION=-